MFWYTEKFFLDKLNLVLKGSPSLYVLTMQARVRIDHVDRSYFVSLARRQALGKSGIFSWVTGENNDICSWVIRDNNDIRSRVVEDNKWHLL